jgi:hypothetical protein
LGANGGSNSVLAGARAWMDNAPGNVVAVQGSTAPALIAANCDSLGGWTPLWVSCYSAMAPTSFVQQGAFLLAVKTNSDAGQGTNLKGRMNFSTLGTGPGHIITLSDSNFQKTIATANNRPTNDANDAFIGYDQGDGNPTRIGISFGAPQSISNYIGNVGDGKKWLERLTPNAQDVYRSRLDSFGRTHPRHRCLYRGHENLGRQFCLRLRSQNTWKRAPLTSW